MSFFKKLFGKKEQQIQINRNRYAEFWQWFEQHQQDFHRIVEARNQDAIQEGFFDKLWTELVNVHDGIFFLAGMADEHTAELILTPDGVIRNIIFVEELIAAAPEITGWKFTALKPAIDIQQTSIGMHGHEFSQKTLSFYLKDHPEYPDEIDLFVVHDEYNEEQKSEFLQGVYIFLDNYLGEYDSVTKLDQVSVQSRKDAEKELMPIANLKKILTLKNSEISRFDKVIRSNTDEDEYISLEGETHEGLPLIATLNSTLLAWDKKASHPWVMIIEIPYDGENFNGMPPSNEYELLESIEQSLVAELKDVEGYLNIGRETGNNLRTIYFACKDFRKPSKIIDQIIQNNRDNFEIDVSFFKDKYWRCLNKFGR
ncbi:DUF695 domain-containing protein [Acinetobacter proteolyticus]|uniref:DUF695 domain-containing protein n=1 Tax=Acinetobacter proteolyticus TaxID=1776741 RepID=A0A2N0WCD1_9GAMM|nr:DUF695 domain-containing protein [Acinetobacter proteolyticus]MBK5648435.1 DUF695 domain-containing protein [Acinetobacter sp.]PKF32168.1 DUF695 domain-containing protein [Acinetobacter proteolyticus]